MTFTEIVAEVCDRLNLTETKSVTRVGRAVNDRYKWLCSTVGLQTSMRTTATASTTIGSAYVSFTSVEKLYSVYNPASTPPRVLDEVTVDELRNMQLGTDPPSCYAVYTMGPTSVTIKLGCVPATIYSLGADVQSNVSTLSGSMVPNFPESYHNILLHGAMADELEKMEKYPLAQVQEAKFEQRLTELRYFIAVSAYKHIHQGKHGADVTSYLV